MNVPHRSLDLTFQLGEGSFGEGGMNQLDLSGLRVSAVISKAGGKSMSTLNLRVFGMTPDQMNKLSTLGLPSVYAYRHNLVAVRAGTDGNFATAFEGVIQDAYADFSSVPDVAFTVTALTGLVEAMKPDTPSSYSGSVSIATVLQDLANRMGYSFQNYGVTAVARDIYYSGSLKKQAFDIASHYGIQMILDDNSTMAIWPTGSTRGSQIPLISKDTGMVGYPAFASGGITITTVYNPAIIYGTAVQVKSVIKPANGVWYAYGISHNLEAETPDGQWFTTLKCSKFQNSLPVAE